MTIYTNFPDKPLPTFTDPTYASEITYRVLDNNVITFNDGYFSATRNSVATVEATTEYHTTTFQVEAKVYEDAKGVDTANWYLSRISSVESKWINNGKKQGGTLFIGDSFFDTEFWSDFYKLYEGNENVYTHGVSSSTTTDWEIFSKRLVYPVAPDNIVMHLGTNNIYDDRESADKVIANTKKLFDEYHARLPETKIYYFAIEPRSYGINGGTFDAATHGMINTVNTSMKEYCDANDYLVYVDATPNCYTEGITVNTDFFRDGIHPRLENYLVYAELLEDAGLDLTINQNHLNTKSFDIAKTEGVGSTNNLIRVNGKALTNKYSVSGKLKITDAGNNPHIQFSLDDSNFNNRFLLWDNDTNGTYQAAYAFAGGHNAASGKAIVEANEEVTWEVVTTEKHSYFYVNGALEFIFLNINAQTLLIGAEKAAVNVYDINAVTNENNAEEYAKVLAREEIAEYEASTDTTPKAIKYIKNTKSFSVAKTDGVASTNKQIYANGKPISNNYSVSGKLKIGESDNNPHIQFSLDGKNFDNRFLLWDDNTDGTYNAAYAANGSHQAKSGNAAIKANEEVTWKVVTTEKHSYFYVNGALEFAFYNINSTSLDIGGEKVAFEAYDINVVTKTDTPEEWNKVLSRIEISTHESSEETATTVVKHTPMTTKSFSVAKTAGVASTNKQIYQNDKMVTHNYSVSGKLKIGESDNNPHIQFSLDGKNFDNRFLLWDTGTQGSYQAGYAFGGSHKGRSGNATAKMGDEVSWEVVTTEKHSYFYVNGSLEFVFLNLNSRSLDIGGEKVAFEAYDIVVVTQTNNASDWANVLAREEIAQYEASTETDAKAIVV